MEFPFSINYVRWAKDAWTTDIASRRVVYSSLKPRYNWSTYSRIRALCELWGGKYLTEVDHLNPCMSSMSLLSSIMRTSRHARVCKHQDEQKKIIRKMRARNLKTVFQKHTVKFRLTKQVDPPEDPTSQCRFMSDAKRKMSSFSKLACTSGFTFQICNASWLW